MNTDAVLPGMDLMDDQHFLQFFSSDQNHYLSNDNCDPLGMPQHDGTNQAMHYMPSKAAPIPKPHINPSRNNLTNMNPAYSHNMGSIASMNSHNQMLNSPPMVQQMDQNQNNGQMNYCKLSTVPISNHYETPPIPRAYQSQGMPDHRHSSSSSSDLNNFNQKYCADSNESVNISTTLTHISETDSSHHNYAPTPPQSQSMKLSAVNNLNMISTPQTYSSMVCNPTNNWSNISSNVSNMNSQMKCVKNSANFPNHTESHFSYLDQANTDFMSISSTPVTSQPQSDPFMLRSNKNNNNNCLEKNKGNSFPAPNGSVKKQKVVPNSDEIPSTILKKDCIMAEKQTIVILKVLERIIDPMTKNILKETIIKDEEINTSCGHVQFDSLNCDTTTTSSIMTRSAIGSSGVLGDISALTTSKSMNNVSSMNSNQSTKSEYALSTNVSRKSDSKNNSALSDTGADDRFIGDIDENDEEERRQTASALLSLQSVNSTPVKELDKADAQLKGVANSARIDSALSAYLSNTTPKENAACNSSIPNEFSFPACEKLRSGIKVMAKWKDKNFYPAQISKQLEPHKWSVKFEDSASRNLFETEMIRIEHLLPLQDVMLTISDDLCTRATIKQIHLRNHKNVEVDLEYSEEEKLIKRRYKLKDIFLNAEQGTSIMAKISKPSSMGAVFADVDLDNIVVGKRSRAKQTIDSSEHSSNQKSSDYSGDESDTNFKKKRKLPDEQKDESISNLSVDCSKNASKPADLHPLAHYHESSLSVSPRSSKPALAMPPHELEKILGPMPKPELKLFDKIGFLLTSGDRNKNMFSEQESRAERSIPFDKVYLTNQIISGDGKVYETFEDMKSSKEHAECVLIADTYHRSIKYIQCLAAGIPIASHLWVIESCRANKLLERDSYILPAGFSVISRSLSSDRNTLKKSSVLFKGMKFYFGSKSADKLEKLWSPVLYAAQAIIVKQDESMHTTLTRKLVDIIIGDATCKPELATRAKQLRIPVISSEYIVQCLINGRKLPYEASPYFSHAYK